jgi:hypothetical protein
MILSKRKGQTVRFEQTVRVPDLVLETFFLKVWYWKLAPLSALAYCISRLTNGVKPKPRRQKMSIAQRHGAAGPFHLQAARAGLTLLGQNWPHI